MGDKNPKNTAKKTTQKVVAKTHRQASPSTSVVTAKK